MWQKFKQRIGEGLGVLTIAPSVALLVIAGSIAGIFQILEWTITDQFFRLRSVEPIDQRIVIVKIEESDLTQIKQWPMSDQMMANLLRKIKNQQPRVIGLDIYRDLPVEPGHQELVKEFESTPELIGIEKVGGNKVNPPPSLNKLDQVAASDLILDADGKVRRGLMLIGNHNGQYRESLAAKLALMYLEKENISLKLLNIQKKIYGLGQAVFVPLTGKESGYVGADTGGYQILINFRGELDRFVSISMKDVLENRIPPDLMRDRIVLIGSTADSLKDIFQTPYSSTAFSNSQLTPGIVIHANLISQILSAALEGRPMLRAWDQTINSLWILAWSLIGALGSWKLLPVKILKKQIFLGGTTFTILTGNLYLIGGGYIAFVSGWIIPVFSPLLALSSSAILMAKYLDQWQVKISNEKLAEANEKLAEYSRNLEVTVDQRTQELKNTLHHLKTTQTHLIQSEKMAALGQLVAGIAHEINNPTSFIYGNITHVEEYTNNLFQLIELYKESCPQLSEEIQGFIEDIDLEYLKADFPKMLKSIKTGAARIREIVKSLRIFSRLDESELKDVDIHEGIDSTLMILQNRLRVRSGYPEIQVIKAYGELPHIPCYAGQLNQVFMNLLANAIDAIEERQEQSKVQESTAYPGMIKIATTIKDNTKIIISISDNGLGISESIQQRLFDPFFTTKAVGKGTGLGLSIAHSIVVEKHGGELQVFSTIGQGAEFQIEIPIKLYSEHHQTPVYQ